MTKEQILDGQQVWQSTGGQQLGSIWGHGAYQAPDWSADWLHRESTALLVDLGGAGLRARPLDRLAPPNGRIRSRSAPASRRCAPIATIRASRNAHHLADRAEAMARTAAHYRALFGGDPSLASLREDYAMQEVTIRDPARLEALTALLLLDELGLRHRSVRDRPSPTPTTGRTNR